MVDPERICRLASLRRWHADWPVAKGCETLLDINDEAKQIVQDLGSAINAAVENSRQVAEAIERLRDAGYEMELTLRLEIGLRPYQGEIEPDDGEDAALELTDEDMRTLRRMRIRIDEGEASG